MNVELFDLILGTLKEHIEEKRKEPAPETADWWYQSTVNRLNLYISAPPPPKEIFWLDSPDIPGLSSWLADAAERIAEDNTVDVDVGLQRELLSLVFAMLREEGEPPWRMKSS